MKHLPSFSIQTLIDQLPGEHFDTNEFIRNSITLKYYTLAEFIHDKFPKNKFSMINLNIASLSAHIDKLRSLISILAHPFDVICLSETKIRKYKPLFNFEINGYEFVHEKSPLHCGGTGIYVISVYNPIEVGKYSGSHPKIDESVFVEIKIPSNKKLLIGCIYRHPSSAVSDFIN